MLDKEYLLREFSMLLQVPIFRIGVAVSALYEKNIEYNPLYRHQELKEKMLNGVSKQDLPYIYCDENMVYFAAVKSNADDIYLIGPMDIELLDRIALHRYYQHYNIENTEEKRLKLFSFQEMLNIIKTVSNILTQKQYTDEELIYINHLAEENEHTNQEYILFALNKEEEELYHHTYQEERNLLNCIKEGRVEDAINSSKEMDVDLGKMSQRELNHWKNATIVAITLCTRAAIEGGISPATAYQLSDFYIQKSDNCSSIAQTLEYRNEAVRELTSRVNKVLKRKKKSTYVERCEDYINNHYREKIYQDTMAQTMNISTTYLSRLFHKEKGIRLQDYIVKVRLEHARNLLLYSNQSITRISEYVNFPSQSYMGKLFKKEYGLSPMKYREINKPSEF